MNIGTSNNISGARLAQLVRSLDLTTHTSLSPIRRGFAPSFVNYKKGALDSQPQVKKFTSCFPRIGGSLRVLRLPPPPWSPWYSWNIVESGVKTPKIKKSINQTSSCVFQSSRHTQTSGHPCPEKLNTLSVLWCNMELLALQFQFWIWM